MSPVSVIVIIIRRRRNAVWSRQKRPRPSTSVSWSYFQCQAIVSMDLGRDEVSRHRL